MNAIIKAIAQEAFDYSLKVDRTPYGEIYDKKFAELLIKECLSIVEPDEDSGDEWCVTLKGAAQEIKQHFGVEK